MEFKDLSKRFSLEALQRNDLSNDPFVQFQRWMEVAVNANIPELNAMSLATASFSGKPSCRIVLLKQFNRSGLVFFTNYESRKAKELFENPYAAATIFWESLMRQISVEGKVEKTSQEESEAYFSQRPRGSQLGAWASQQDQTIASREVLEEKLRIVTEKYQEKAVPIPPYWGGFRLIPSRFEFWQGAKDRMHDRFHYVPEGDGWKVERLSP
ncbi:MAG TPA: pyridoxamine 5'-phosphate oxidase [Waddliaceae bacterium]